MMSEKNLLTNPRLNLLLQISFWLVFYILHVLILSVFLPLDIVLVRSIGNILPLALLFYINLYLINRFWERQQIGFYFVWAFLLVVAGVFLRVQINLAFPEIDRTSIQVSPQTTYRVGGFIMTMSILVLSALYQLLQNRYREQQKRGEVIQQQQEAQLQFLKQQINPHFLFNTLNNIYSLAVTGSDKTAGMVLKLSDLLRYVIYESREERVDLHKEVDHINQFIQLFQMRSETQLDIQFSYPDQLNSYQIEPMILIPLVENCFKHCDFDTNPKAFTRIELDIKDEFLYFKTLNTKNDTDLQKDKTGGVGLANIHRRLELKSPNQYELQPQNKGTHFEVSLKLKANK
jgi:two-component system LytT family sensor kinase